MHVELFTLLKSCILMLNMAKVKKELDVKRRISVSNTFLLVSYKFRKVFKRGSS